MRRLSDSDARLLRESLVASEQSLLARIVDHAVAAGYGPYTPTSFQAWRVSVVGVTEAITGAVDRSSDVPAVRMEPDPAADPIAAFGVAEARRHRHRGVTLPMFLGLFTYFRLACHEVLAPQFFSDPATVHRFVDAVFDRIEIGYVAEWAGTSADTRTRQLGEANLRLSRERARLMALFDGLPMPAMLVADDGTVELHNRLANALFGSPGGSVRSYTAPDTLAPEGSDWVRDLVADVTAGPVVMAASHDITLDTPVGPRLFSAYVERLSDVTPQLSGYAVVLTDVTEERAHQRRLTAARALREELTRQLADRDRLFRLVFESSPIGMALIGVGAHAPDQHLRVNAAMLEMLGYSEAEFLSIRHSALLHHDDVAVARTAIQEAAAGRANPEPVRLRMRAKDGRVLSTLVHTVAVRDGTGSVDYVLRQVQDQTEKLRVEEEMRRAQQLEAVGALAAGIAHEINTPIQFIADNVSFLERAAGALAAAATPGSAQIPEEDAAFYAEEIPAAVSQTREGIERVASIVRAMRMFGHMDTETPEAADLEELVISAVTMARHETKSVADVDVEIAPGIEPLLCFPGGLRQALLNVIVNAAHAIAERDGDEQSRRGRIGIRVSEGADGVVVVVSDDGVGIPREQQERVFQPFFTTKPAGKGTGQGLPMVHSIVVDRHHGRLRLDSQPGVGTTLTLTIPRMPTPADGSDDDVAGHA